MTDCVFCKPNWPNLDVVTRPGVHVRIIRPLDPVTEGHVLVIHDDHTPHAAYNPHLAGVLMHAAADYVRFRRLQANIITSVGADATQTVFHTHLHVVPRRPDDGLLLPWTPQQEAAQRAPRCTCTRVFGHPDQIAIGHYDCPVHRKVR